VNYKDPDGRELWRKKKAFAALNDCRWNALAGDDLITCAGAVALN